MDSYLCCVLFAANKVNSLNYLVCFLFDSREKVIFTLHIVFLNALILTGVRT